MAPKAGQLIRITAVKDKISTNIRVGTVMIVGDDDRPPEHRDPDGYHWIQSPDYPNTGCSAGWVKWEAVEFVAAEERAAEIAALKTAMVYHDGEPLSSAIVRLVGERDSERRRSRGWPEKLHDASKQIKQLESEVLRLSSPPGSSFQWDGVQGKPLLAGPGWVRWESVPAAAPVPDESKLHARCGRQRRELRRLNQNNRLMRAELQIAQRQNEDLGVHCVDQQRRIRILESAIK